MGNQNSSKVTHSYNPKLNDWQLLHKGTDYNIWRNINTLEEVEQHTFILNDQRDYNQEKLIHEFRYQNAVLIASKFFREDKQSELCSTYFKGQIYLQKTSFRINKIKDIPYPDILHVYAQVFRGFAILYAKYGFFYIQEDLIAINQSAKVKVWMNSQFAKPELPLSLSEDTQMQKSEKQMIFRLFEIIQPRTNSSLLPQNIVKFILNQKPSTLNQAYNVVVKYATKYKTTIPEQLDSVLNFNNSKPQSFIQEISLETKINRKISQKDQNTITRNGSINNVVRFGNRTILPNQSSTKKNIMNSNFQSETSKKQLVNNDMINKDIYHIPINSKKINKSLNHKFQTQRIIIKEESNKYPATNIKQVNNNNNTITQRNIFQNPILINNNLINNNYTKPIVKFNFNNNPNINNANNPSFNIKTRNVINNNNMPIQKILINDNIHIPKSSTQRSEPVQGKSNFKILLTENKNTKPEMLRMLEKNYLGSPNFSINQYPVSSLPNQQQNLENLETQKKLKPYSDKIIDLNSMSDVKYSVYEDTGRKQFEQQQTVEDGEKKKIMLNDTGK